MNNPDRMSYEYKGFKIILFHNSGKWDYKIPRLTTKGYKSSLNLYDTKQKALESAQNQIEDLT
ncbi:MAG: hypothetical protein ACOCQ5_06250 [Halanaerobiales bacterium]